MRSQCSMQQGPQAPAEAWSTRSDASSRARWRRLLLYRPFVRCAEKKRSDRSVKSLMVKASFTEALYGSLHARMGAVVDARRGVAHN